MKSEENLINNKMWLNNYIENIDGELDRINQVKIFLPTQYRRALFAAQMANSVLKSAN